MRPTSRDGLLGLSLTLLTVAEIPLVDADPVAAQAALGVVVGLAVAVRRAAPAVMVAALVVSISVFGLTGLEPETVGPAIGFWIAFFTIGQDLPAGRAAHVLAGAGLCAFATTAVSTSLVDVVFTQCLFVLIPYGLGRLAGDRRRQVRELEQLTGALERQRASAAALAETAERARIAHDLHDGLSHGLGVLTLQAAAGMRLAETDEDAAGAALHAIRAACAQVSDDLALAGPQPSGLGGLDALVAGVRGAGVAVEFHHSVTAPMTAEVEIAIHRIVQEALTNALRHARPRTIVVDLRYQENTIVLVIEHDGTADRPDVPAPGHGLGLAGMRERARSCGGLLEHGALEGGGFRVAAELPSRRA